jgi:flagellar basal body-associated protein FliL
MKNGSVIWIMLLLAIVAGVAIVVFSRSKGTVSNDGNSANGTSPGLTLKDLLYKAPTLNLNTTAASGADLYKFRQAAGQTY